MVVKPSALAKHIHKMLELWSDPDAGFRALGSSSEAVEELAAREEFAATLLRLSENLPDSIRNDTRKVLATLLHEFRRNRELVQSLPTVANGRLAQELDYRNWTNSHNELRRLADRLEEWVPTASDSQRDTSAKNENEASHSVDFASVNWYGTQYIFTTNQAACVRILWEAWENKTPVLGGVTIIEAAGVDRSDERLDLVFRGHPAWGAMIVSPSKGRYCLKVPDVAP